MHDICAFKPVLAALAKGFRPTPEMPEPSLPVVGWALAEGVGLSSLRSLHADEQKSSSGFLMIRSA